MDKTGTLTLGRPKVVEFIPLGGRSELELLTVAAAIEARSEHPIARAILDAATERGVALLPAKSVTALPGKGVVGRSEEHTSELQSLMRISYDVICLKNKNRTNNHI